MVQGIRMLKGDTRAHNTTKIITNIQPLEFPFHNNLIMIMMIEMNNIPQS